MNFEKLVMNVTAAEVNLIKKQAALKQYPLVPKKQLKKIFQDIQRMTGIEFPNVRFDGRPKRVISKDKTCEFSYLDGIVVLQADDKIPNLSKVEAYLKKLFGDVSTHGNRYINVREYGKEPEKDKLILPRSLKKLPNAKKLVDSLKKAKTSDERGNIVRKAKDAVESRRVKVQGKPGLKILKTIGKGTSAGKLVVYDDKMLYADVFTLYQVADAKEAVSVFNILQIYNNVMRHLEVESWQHQDFSSPI